MDERQTKITEGAGLQEARINRGLLEFLERYSTPVLALIVVICGGYYAWNWWKTREARAHDAAFGEFAALSASGTVNPQSLLDIADAYPTRGAVADLARLRAADAYLSAVRTGLKPGAAASAGEPAADDLLTDEDRTFYLSEASRLYGAVLESARGDAARVLVAVNAASGLAAAAATRGDAAEAERLLNEAAAMADAAGFPGLADEARAAWGAASDAPAELPQAASLPPMPGRPEPEPEPSAPPTPAETTAGPSPDAAPAADNAPQAEPQPEPAPAEPAAAPNQP